MRPKKKLKAPFVMISAAAAAVSLVVACGGKAPGGENTSNPPGPPGVACTPSPRAGEHCAADDTPCTMTSFGQATITCDGGRWVEQPGLVGNPPSPPQPPQCPANAPTEGVECNRSGADCLYVDPCGGRPSTAPATSSYACLDFVWKRTSATYVAACPVAPPLPGDSCESCAGLYPAQCTYQGDGGCPTSFVCGPKTPVTWTSNASTCNPPPPDAGGGM